MTLPGYHIRMTTKINLASFLSRIFKPLPQNVYLEAARMGDSAAI
jgi:hypothetical protein